MTRIVIQTLAIICCNLSLVDWYKYAFALGEFLIGTGGRVTLWQVLRYSIPLVLALASLVAIGWTALRWPLLQPALATMYLFFLSCKDLPMSDWPSLLLAYAILYCVALIIVAGTFALRRRRRMKAART